MNRGSQHCISYILGDTELSETFQTEEGASLRLFYPPPENGFEADLSIPLLLAIPCYIAELAESQQRQFPNPWANSMETRAEPRVCNVALRLFFTNSHYETLWRYRSGPTNFLRRFVSRELPCGVSNESGAGTMPGGTQGWFSQHAASTLEK